MIKNIPTTYSKDKFVIPKNSVYQIQFNGNKPNFYRVINLGETTLYFATNNVPKDDLYDFKCSPKGTANFAEIFTRDFLYCLNPSNDDVEILLTYWAGEFDASFIAFGEGTLNVEGTVKTDGVINAFNTSLPAGSNVIGGINLLGQSFVALTISAANIKNINDNTVNVPDIYSLFKNYIKPGVQSINNNLQLIKHVLCDNLCGMATYHEIGNTAQINDWHLPIDDSIRTFTNSLSWTTTNNTPSSDIDIILEIITEDGEYIDNTPFLGGNATIPEGKTLGFIHIWINKFGENDVNFDFNMNFTFKGV